MDLLICHVRSEKFLELLQSLEEFEIWNADSAADFATALVQEHGIACAVVQTETLEKPWLKLLDSAMASFPFLNVLYSCASGSPEQGLRFSIVQGNPADPGGFDKVAAYLRSCACKDKRIHQRFDWPLEGTLRVSDTLWRRYRVRAISASGAFLEADGVPPAAGTSAMLSIRFADFSLLSDVEVMQPREATPTLPRGFGVRFTSLTEGSQRVVDHIVQDELVRHLLGDSSVETPIIGQPAKPLGTEPA